jgi:periplasmic protein TonB
MRRLFVLLLATMLLTAKAHAQIADSTTTEKFYVVDKSAQFPGGMAKFYENYISKNLKYPKDAKELMIEGKVHVEFVIESTGEIRQESVRAVRGIHSSCDDEAVRLIQQSPRWTPAFSTELGKNVAQKFVVPIIFKLAK